MKKRITKSNREHQLTRRELIGGALASASVIMGAPAFLRGQNLNSRLNIAMIACGGRALANMNGDGGGDGRGGRNDPESGPVRPSDGNSGRKHHGPLRRQPECRGCCGPEIPKSEEIQ